MFLKCMSSFIEQKIYKLIMIKIENIIYYCFVNKNFKLCKINNIFNIFDVISRQNNINRQHIIAYTV